MVTVKELNGNFQKDRYIHIESNMWSTTHRLKKAMDLMLLLGLNEKKRSFGYCKQCALVW